MGIDVDHSGDHMTVGLAVCRLKCDTGFHPTMNFLCVAEFHITDNHLITDSVWRYPYNFISLIDRIPRLCKNLGYGSDLVRVKCFDVSVA